jgi:eukaryotic-like serine/threonine-protein kinase
MSDAANVVDGPYAVGDVVDGRYRLIRPLGQGGMGTVWVAEDQVLDVHVALKLVSLRNRGPQQHTLTARLLQEARTAAKLTNPAICRVLNYGSTAVGDPYIASELLDGESLGEMIARVQRCSAVEALRLILPIVDALASAHARGIVHRDVKPDNICLARADAHRLQPKLLDFGIARVMHSDSKITLEGALLGTPDYMSPEQARGDADTDGRTDVWSIAVVIYELVTGQVPFPGDNYNRVLWAVINQDPRPTTAYGAGDAALWAIVERGLAKDPNARWQSMRDFGVALAQWLYDCEVTEDLCGASLRSTWIEASFSGDRPSQVYTPPESLRHGLATLRGDTAASRARGSSPGGSTDARISLSGRPRSPSLLGLDSTRGKVVVAGLCVILLGLVAALLVRSPQDPGKPTAVAAAQSVTYVVLSASPAPPPVFSPPTEAPEAAPHVASKPRAAKAGGVAPKPSSGPPKAGGAKKTDDYALGF